MHQLCLKLYMMHLLRLRKLMRPHKIKQKKTKKLKLMYQQVQPRLMRKTLKSSVDDRPEVEPEVP